MAPPDGDRQRRARSARTRASGGTDFVVRRSHLDPGVVVDWSHLRRDCRLLWRTYRQRDDAHCRRAVFTSLRDCRHRTTVIVSQSDALWSARTAVHCARLDLMANDGQDCARTSAVTEEPGVCAGGACDWSFWSTVYLLSPSVR